MTVLMVVGSWFVLSVPAGIVVGKLLKRGQS